VQSELSLWSRQDEKDILPTCSELGIGYLAYSPLGRGFLTGTVTTVEHLDAKDTRKNHPRFKEENIRQNWRIAQSLKVLAEKKGVTPAQLALAWVLHQRSDIVPIPGSKQLKRVQENMLSAQKRLTEEELLSLNRIAPEGSTQGERYPAMNLAHIDR